MKKFFFICLFITGLVYAGTTGKIAGKVTDTKTGEPLIGANIQIMGTTLGATADASGNYVILNIPPGTVSLKYSFLGYETKIIENVKIVADQTTNLSITLGQTSMQVGEVVVTAKTPMIQKDLTSTISVITRETIEALPVSSFNDLLALQAGVVGNGSNLHIRGGRAGEVAYLIDGMVVKDPLLGENATQINNDAIQEMNLLSGTFNAEYGNALSGVVNIVTREGSEKLNGKIEARTSEFGVTRYKQLHENRINGSLDGPLFFNDLRFFLSGEADNRGSYLPWGYNKSVTGFSKITWIGTPGIKAGISNRGSKTDRQSYNHLYKYIPDQYLKRRSDSWQTAFTFSHSTAKNFFYDLKVSYFNQGLYSGLNKDTSQYMLSQDYVYLATAGNGFEFYERSDPDQLTDSRTTTLDFRGDAVWQFNSANEIKFGLQAKKHSLSIFDILDPKRTFPYVNNYSTNPFEASGYVQDKIEFPYLIINLGLRFDYMNANTEYRPDPFAPASIVKSKSKTQVSPRIGIAHPISDRTKLHFSYGHFFQYPDFEYLYQNRQYDFNVREPLIGSPDLDAQRTIAYEIGVAHQFTDRIAAHISAYYKDVTGLIGTKYFFPYTGARKVGYTLYVNEDYANMKGFEVNVDIRPDRYFSGGFTYTFSVAKGSASSETEQYPGTQESTLLYYLDFDKTHMVNASVSFTIPKGEGPVVFDKNIFESLDISIIGRASSGYPYTPGGRDVGFVVKNSLRQPSSYSIDLLIGKEISISPVRLRIFAEVLNLTDKRNVLYVYRDTGDPDFTFEGGHSREYMQDPSNYGPPRTIRLGASVKF